MSWLKRPSTREKILEVDGQLLIAAERLRTYRSNRQTVSCIVQMGVIDRMLDQRLVLMQELAQ